MRAALPAAVAARTMVVVAAYNEAPALAAVIADLRRHRLRVVVVDDGSRDATAEVAAAAGATVLRHRLNRGQGAALQTGLSWALAAGAGYIVTFDADGQHVADDLPALLAPLVDGAADIALGSRFLGSAEAMPRSRRLLLKAAVLLTRLTSGLALTDAHNGLRAFSRAAAGRIDLRMDRMAHASELIDQVRASRLPFVEVPVHVRYTPYSRAKGQRLAAAGRVLWEYFFGRLLAPGERR